MGKLGPVKEEKSSEWIVSRSEDQEEREELKAADDRRSVGQGRAEEKRGRAHKQRRQRLAVSWEAGFGRHSSAMRRGSTQRRGEQPSRAEAEAIH